MGADRVYGRDRRDDHGVCSLNFSFARVGLIPVDVPLAFFNKNGHPVNKCNKEKFTEAKILCYDRTRKAPLPCPRQARRCPLSL